MSRAACRAALATKHGKESIFGPAFAGIGIDVVVAEVDTDRFGTFSGEIERQGSPRDTVVQKARSAIEVSGLPIGLASEGSFGPHPATPFLLADTEIVVYVDDVLGYSVFESAQVVSAVPSSAVVDDAELIDDLKITTTFPEQRAIVVAENPDTRSRRVLAKGISTVGELRSVITRALAERSHPVIVEPDLRAHHCPDRRKVIRTAVDRLIARLSVACPQCDAAGFGPLRTIPGLRCGLCGLPTTRPSADVMGCGRCGFETEITRVGQADPTFCDRCNP